MVAGTTAVEEGCEDAGDGGVRGEVRWPIADKGEVDQEVVDEVDEAEEVEEVEEEEKELSNWVEV